MPQLVSFQSQQARLATLYLPLFGVLQENVYRLDMKDSALLSSHGVSLTPSGSGKQNTNHRVDATSRCFLLQNAREDVLMPNSMLTSQKPGSCIENALHKDVFGVISGTGK